MLKGTSKCTGKDQSAKSEQTTLHKLQEWKLPKVKFHVITGMLPNVQHSKIQANADSETSEAHKHTAKSGAKMQISAAIAFHSTSNDELQMQLRKFQSDAKTQYRLRLHHLANKYVLTRKEKLGPPLVVIQTRSQNQRNPNAPTFEDRSIEWTSSMEEKSKESSLDFTHKNV